MEWFTFFLLFLLFALSFSSLLTYHTQNQLLIQCQQRQAMTQQRLDGVLRSFTSMQKEEGGKLTDRASEQTQKVVSFLAEVLGSRETKRKSDFESLLLECTEKATAANITFTSQVTSYQTRTTSLLKDLEESTNIIRRLTTEVDTAKFAAKRAEEKCSHLPSTGLSEADEHLLRERLDQAIRRIEKLKAEIKQLKSSRASDANFFSSLDDEPRSSLITTIPTKPFSHIETEKPTVPTNKHCDKDAVFVFNSKRSGMAYEIHTATSANRCKRLCLSEHLCLAWTYVSDSTECLLHRDIGEIVIADCCVSGIKCT